MKVEHGVVDNIIDEIKKKCAGMKAWKPLESTLQRTAHTIALRWSRMIYPSILSYLSNTVNLQWKEPLLRYIIENKVSSIPDLDWNIVLEKWPSCTKQLLQETLTNANYLGDKGVALYQNLSNNLHRMKMEQKVSQSKLKLIYAFDKLRNEV